MHLLLFTLIGIGLAPKRQKAKNKIIRDEYVCEDCVVCLECVPSIWFQPCGHTCVCEPCVTKNSFSKCPVCRKEIKEQAKSPFRGTRVKFNGDEVGYFMHRSAEGEFIIEIPKSQVVLIPVPGSTRMVQKLVNIQHIDEIEPEIVVLPKSAKVVPVNQKKDKVYVQANKALENHEVNLAISLFEQSVLKDDCHRFAMCMIKKCYELKIVALTRVLFEQANLPSDASNSLWQIISEIEVGPWKHPKMHFTDPLCFECGKENPKYTCDGCGLRQYCGDECIGTHQNSLECEEFRKKAAYVVGFITKMAEHSMEQPTKLTGEKPPSEVFKKKNE